MQLLSIYRDSHYHEYSVYLRPYVPGGPYLKALIVGDSRLWRLPSSFWDGCEANEITVIAQRGGRIHDLLPRALEKVVPFRNTFYSVKICCGVNDVLSGVSPSHIIQEFQRFRGHVLNIDPGVMVSFAQIYPIDHEAMPEHSRTRIHGDPARVNDHLERLNGLVLNDVRRALFSPYDRPPAVPKLNHAVVRGRGSRRNGVNALVRSRLVDGLHGDSLCNRKVVLSLVAAINTDIATYKRFDH